MTTLIATVSQWHAYGATQPQQLHERLRGADIAISNKVVLDERVFASIPSLKLVCVAATGYNNIDLVAANRYGVTVCNARDYSTPSVVQHVYAMLLGLYRRLVRQESWQRIVGGSPARVRPSQPSRPRVMRGSP